MSSFEISRKFCQTLQFFLIIDCDQFVFDKNRTRSQEISWKVVKFLTIVVYGLIMVWYIGCILAIGDTHKSNLVGDWIRFMSPPGKEMVFFGVALNLTGMGLTICIFTWYFQSTPSGSAVMIEILEPLKILANTLTIDSNEKRKMVKTVRHCRLVVDIVLGLVLSSYGPFATYMFIVYFDWSNYFFSGILGLVMVFTYIFMAVGAMATSAVLFSFACSQLNSKLAHFLVTLRTRSEKLTIHWIRRQLALNSSIVSIIDRYNRYFSMYILIFHVTYLSMICCFAYIAFIARIEGLLLKIMFPILTIEYTIFLSAICLSAAVIQQKVSH